MSIRTAFVLGAGRGTRLMPLTRDCPKPLLPIQGQPMITYAFEHLAAVGVERFIVNTHHCADRYAEVFPEGSWQGIPIHFCHEPVLLDTAGGLKNIEPLLQAEDESLLVYNGDIWTDFSLQRLMDFHQSHDAVVSLALRSEGEPRNVGWQPDSQQVLDFRNKRAISGLQATLFSGIYVVRRRFFDFLVQGKVESVVDVFLRMLEEGREEVKATLCDDGMWQDLGTIEAYNQANQ